MALSSPLTTDFDTFPGGTGEEHHVDDLLLSDITVAEKPTPSSEPVAVDDDFSAALDDRSDSFLREPMLPFLILGTLLLHAVIIFAYILAIGATPGA